MLALGCSPSAKPIDPTTPTVEADASALSPTSAPVVDASVPVVASDVPDAAVASAPDASPPVAQDGCGGTAAPYEMKVRPEVKKCFFEAKKTHPALTGEIHIGLNVDMKGQLQKAVIVEEKDLGKEGVACIQKALKSETLDGSGCKGKSITFAMAFGAAAR
jgi:hypothetical protein